MSQTYYDTVTKLEEAGTDAEYINGWMSGWHHNPLREEQRITDAYQAGYDDGAEQNTDNADKFKA